MNFAARTAQGRVKTENQDTLVLLPEHALWGVCDGMGGMNQGGFASRFTVDQLVATPESELADALREASRRLHKLAQRSRGLFWTGTTAVLARVQHGVLEVAHAGDSRAYFLRRRLVPLTRDHSLAESLGVSPDYPHARSMTRYVGMRDLEPEVRRWRWTRPGRLLLCSDGVNNELSDPQIEACLAQGSPTEACDRLVDAALEAGGRDNISVVVLDGP